MARAATVMATTAVPLRSAARRARSLLAAMASWLMARISSVADCTSR